MHDRSAVSVLFLCSIVYSIALRRLPLFFSFEYSSDNCRLFVFVLSLSRASSILLISPKLGGHAFSVSSHILGFFAADSPISSEKMAKLNPPSPDFGFESFGEYLFSSEKIEKPAAEAFFGESLTLQLSIPSNTLPMTLNDAVSSPESLLASFCFEPRTLPDLLGKVGRCMLGTFFRDGAAGFESGELLSRPVKTSPSSE
mmetsp:Transcript_4600/g.7076  ORF Transcript_4600/g.7076 Transcript_4600/m.7076 type:complete len:200 (-) Transcript_4600:2260-2859(-)